jgi:hypothetical protein
MDYLLDMLVSTPQKYPDQLQMWTCDLQLFPGCEGGNIIKGVD